MTNHTAKPIVRLDRVSVQLPTGRQLWQDLSLSVNPGEFLVVLGPNGAGKTTLLQLLLGLTPVTSGVAEVASRTPRRGNDAIGYVPQQGSVDATLPLRGRDLVRLGLDGHRFGIGLLGSSARVAVDRALEAVGATAFADQPMGQLSGGEQQRLRIAQAIVSNPQLLLCDEPFASLDLGHQQTVGRLIDSRRREAGTAVILVTHDVNPVLTMADRILYLVGHSWAIGTPDKILTTATLTKLYGAPVEVLRLHGRVLVVSSAEAEGQVGEAGGHHHAHDHAAELSGDVV